VVAHFSHHLLTALPTPLLPFIRDEFALDYTRVGLIISAFSLSYGISQLPAGWISDRIGPRIVITMGISGVAVFGLLVGVSQTFTMMLIFLVLMGMVAGGYHPTAPALISTAVGSKTLGRALGFHAVGGSASYFLAPIVAAAMASVWGWRSPFIGLAIPTAAFGIVFYILLGQRAAADKIEHEPSSSPTEIPYAPGYLRRLAPFIILSTFTAAMPFSVASFIPLFMVDKFGVSREMAAYFLALIYSAGFWAAPLGGYLSDRLGRVKLLIVVGFVTSLVIYLLNLATYSLGIGALLIGIGMLNYIRMPVSESYIISQTPENRRSTILGIYYFGGMEGMGMLTPVIGYLIDNFGFHITFTIAGATIALVSLICSIFLWKIRD
jgi:FSR family fosmidomycin resistance protein-like MFS transporter